MALDPQAKYRLERLRDVVDFYSENPITENFRGVRFSTWKLVLSLAFPEILEKVQSPAGINSDALSLLKETINNQLAEQTALSDTQKTNLETSLPPNLQELIDNYEKYARSKNLTGEERASYLDALIQQAGTANKAVFKKWEEQRLENIRQKLEENRSVLLKKTEDAARNAIQVNGVSLPGLENQEDQLAKTMTGIVEQIALSITQNGPKTQEEIVERAKPIVTGEIEKVIGNSDVAKAIAEEFLKDNTVQAIQTVSKLRFTETALLNQYDGKSPNGPFPDGIIPESLQNFSDKEIAQLAQQVTSPYQSGLSAKELSSIQQQLFVLIKREVILPYGQLEAIAINKVTQRLTDNDIVSKIEVLLKNSLPLNLTKTMQSVKIDSSTIEILNAVRFSNWFFSKESKNEGAPPGRLSIQERNSFLGSLQKLESAITNRGTNDVFSTVKTFIETNRNESWFKIISKASSLLPNNPHGIGYTLFTKYFKKNAEGYILSPLSLFKMKAINFTGSLFTKAGTKLGSKFLLGIGAKILGVAAGGPVGAVIAFAPQILSLLNKSPQFGLLKKGVVIAAGAIGALFVYGLGLLGSLGAAVTTGVLGGAVVGTFIAGPVGFVVGGIVGGIIGGIVSWVTQTMAGGSAATAAATTPIAAGTSSLVSSVSSGALTPTVLAIVPTATATIATGALLIYTYMVSSTSLFVPQGEEGLLGSTHIDISKKVNVGGLNNPNNIQNTVVGEKAIYQLTVGAHDIPLKDITIVDKTTVTNKNGSKDFADRYIAENQAGTYVLKEKTTGEWNKTTDTQLQEMTGGSSWNKLYGFTITNDMKDSFVSNTVTITATNDQGGTETKSITLTFSIGTPPLPPVSLVAKNLIDRLVDCYGAEVQRTTILQNAEGKQCIINALKKPSLPPGLIINFKQTTANTIYQSTSFGNLQCVGFVQAVLIEAGQPIPSYIGQGNGADFSGSSPGQINNGYTWHAYADLKNIKSGDIFVSKNTTEGHIAIVYTSDNAGFILAEALGDAGGKGRIQYSFWKPFSFYETAPNVGFWRRNK